MQKSIKILQQALIGQFFFLIILFIIFSCSQNNRKKPDAAEKKNELNPPATITVKAPIVTLLDTCPLPLTITIPEKREDSFVLKINNSTTVILPPETKPADFSLLMQNYNTSDGLAHNTMYSSIMDKKGNLWFGTVGGTSRYDGKSFTNFSAVHGLANNNVFSILEDKSGNLWFGTLTGVSCYDGKSFTNYTTAQGLVNNAVQSILEDKSGNLWFGTRGGVSRLKPYGKSMPHGKLDFTNYTIAQGLADNNVLNIIEDKKGNLWFGTRAGISRYDAHLNDTVGPGKFLPDGKAGFKTYTTAQGLANNVVRSIIEDKMGNLWFGTEDGISRLDRDWKSLPDGKAGFDNYTTLQGLVNNNILSILEDKDGNLWFGTKGGVSYYNQESQLDGKAGFINYTTFRGLTHNNVTSIVEDKSGNIWFSTGDGVSRLDRDWKSLPGGKTAFTSYATIQGEVNNSVTSILEDRKGNLWFATLGVGVFRLNWNGITFTTYTTAQGLVNNVVRSIIEDRKGNIWFVTDGGVSRLDGDGKFFTNYTTAQGLANNLVRCIIEDKNENLWFGTVGGGVSRLDRDSKSFTTYTTSHGLANNTVRSLIEDKTGNLWFSTLGGGVSRLDRDWKFFTNYTAAHGLANNYVWNLFGDKSGNLWCGTELGVSRFDGRSFINYTTAQGMGDNGVWDIVMDKKGTIWMGTGRGFTALKGFAQDKKNTFDPSPEQNLQPANQLSNYELISSGFKPVFEIYNIKTGYPLHEINLNGMCVTREGIIWAGTTHKLIRFDYNSLHKNPDPPNVFIQSIRINNENICWYDLTIDKEKTDSITTAPNITEEITFFGKVLSEAQRDTIRKKLSGVRFDSITHFYPLPVNLVLPYEHNNLTFDFAAIEPARPFLVRYQYMLEGYDDDWNLVSNETSASFGNISEGSYTFKLKAQSPDGVWSEPIIYTFKVLPPWHRTWWAYTLYILVFLTALWIFIKWRLRALKKEKILLEEKVANRTNELREEKEKVESTLTELKSTQAQLIQSEKMASLGELTAGIAHEIQNPLNFVNNFSEVSKDLLDEMKIELDKGNSADAKELASDVIQNLEKINQHGKRADAIVKGMLQHSRSDIGVKESVDINALTDEYLRLSYHGLRAKDNTFYITLKTDFDNTIGKMNIVPQDIGRVLFNLLTNAFYAVNQKKKQQQLDYEPAVTIKTKKDADRVEIKVVDNGNGIPNKVVDKIFQPFFTTKPTGQGTGLGLSLSYDIIKAHGGEIKVETKEGEGTEFIIKLPMR